MAEEKEIQAEEEEVENIPGVEWYSTRPAIVKDYEIIRHVILTEESQRLQDEENAMVFAVDKRANKTEIKAAIQAIFSAKVKSVNIINVRSKKKRVGRYTGSIPGYKKAIVRFDSSFDLGKIQDAVANSERQGYSDDEE